MESIAFQEFKFPKVHKASGVAAVVGRSAGVSICSSSDQYLYEFGVKLAAARMCHAALLGSAKMTGRQQTVVATPYETVPHTPERHVLNCALNWILAQPGFRSQVLIQPVMFSEVQHLIEGKRSPDITPWVRFSQSAGTFSFELSEEGRQFIDRALGLTSDEVSP